MTLAERLLETPDNRTGVVYFTLKDGVIYKANLIEVGLAHKIQRVRILAASDRSTNFTNWQDPFPLDRRVRLYRSKHFTVIDTALSSRD